MADLVDDTEELLELDEYAYQSAGSTALSCEKNRKAVLVYWVMLCFLASAGYTITLPSMYLFLQELGVCEGTAMVLGCAVAIYSLGQVLSSVAFGHIGRRVSISYCILFALGCDVVGNLLYAQSGSVWMLLPGRLLAGIGAGNVSLARRYVTTSFPPLARTSATSYLATAQAIGFIYGPAVACVMSWVKFEFIGMEFNPFTAPAYFSALTSFIATICLALFFRQLPRLESLPPMVDGGSFGGGDEAAAKKRKKIGVFVLLFIFFVVTQIFVAIETTVTPTTSHYFGWTAQHEDITDGCDGVTHADKNENGVLFNGLLFMTMGAVAFLTLSVMANYKRLPIIHRSGAPSPYLDRVVLVLGWAVMLGGCLMAFPWTSMQLWLYIIGAHLIGPVGYCMGQVTALSIYSRIIADGGGQPIKLLGWISHAGSVARITGPLIAGALFWGGHVELLITVIFDVLAVGMVCVLITWPCLTHDREAPLATFSADGVM